MGRKLRTTVPILPSELCRNWDFIETFRKNDFELILKQIDCHDLRQLLNDLPHLSLHDYVYVNEDRNVVKRAKL